MYQVSISISRKWNEFLTKQDVFVKHNAPDNGQFQRRPRSQGQIF